VLEEAESSGALSPRAQVASVASPRALQKAVSVERAKRTSLTTRLECSECGKMCASESEGSWAQFSSLGEATKRFVCSECVKMAQMKRRTSSPPPLNPTSSRVKVIADTKIVSVRVEEPGNNNAIVLEDVFEPYRLQFFNKAQLGFACVDRKALACVSMTAKEGVFKCLAMTPAGHVLHDAKEEIVLTFSGSLAEKMRVYLQTVWFADSLWVGIEDSKMFSLELLGLEASHAANASAFRMGVVYCGEDQQGEEVCFANTNVVSERFWSFLDLMGERVRINSFSGFSGGFEDVATEPDKQSYYVSWLNLEIMYHVAPLLNPEEQRRLLGNDLVLIYFHESDHPFDAYEFRGHVTSIAIVVKPLPNDKYVVGCFARRRVKEFGPSVGVEVAASDLKNYLLTKAVNAIVAAQKSPPFAQMIAKLFVSDIEKILEKHNCVKKGKSNSRVMKSGPK
jgi:hypothetical protein